ncbi:MAG: CstA-like transporter-associated (seleno)protein [Sulfuricella sp.]
MLRNLWRVIRRLTGDDAYERYLRHHAEVHPHEMPLGRKEFFKREQDRKWSGVRRCC